MTKYNLIKWFQIQTKRGTAVHVSACISVIPNNPSMLRAETLHSW